MTRLPTFVAAAAVVCLVAPFTPASAQSVASRTPEATLARAGLGSIHGLVLDIQGRPLVGAMVSALGSTVAFALTGRDGRFLFDGLPAGAYTLRVHLDGYAPSQRQMIEVRSSTGPSVVSVALKALGAATGQTILAASILPLDGVRTTTEDAGDGSTLADPDHSHSETAWRLRHLKRSVLKDVDSSVILGDDPMAASPEPAGSFFARTFENSARLAAAIFSDLPISGQVNLVATGAFNAPSEFLSPGALATASVAYISLGAPMGRLGNWTVSGAMTQGNLGSWFVSGSLTARPSSPHRYAGGLTYSTQRYNTADPLALAAISAGSRSMGTIYGVDEWVVSRRVSIGYGLSYSWQDYARSDSLLSPRFSLTVMPLNRTRLRGVVVRNAVAPGADEFRPMANGLAGVWLPSQRSFSAWSERAGLRPQTTEHYEIGIERDIAAYVIGFRTFFQHVDDQAGAMFAVPSLTHPAATLGHYYIANLGDLDARGWSVSVSRPLTGAVRGSVDYSVTTARWQNTTDYAMAAWFGDARRFETERTHDLTTSVETAISQTATRVYVLYKLNSGFARPSADARGPGFDSRFDVQVNQSLPFLNFTSADWEVLVAVCNLFRDATGERSIYDELLVVRPPKRVVGGVRVRF
ncbi:MAG: TonB-dependent receptor [Acidobacteria bacterium]|nr:TonB-dependent receptor [Acidobacteriota bacterium]